MADGVQPEAEEWEGDGVPTDEDNFPDEEDGDQSEIPQDPDVDLAPEDLDDVAEEPVPQDEVN